MHKCLGAFRLYVYWKEVTFDFLHKIKDWNLVTKSFFNFLSITHFDCQMVKIFFTYSRRPSPMV
jgi:hypothetical protein